MSRGTKSSKPRRSTRSPRSAATTSSPPSGGASRRTSAGTRPPRIRRYQKKVESVIRKVRTVGEQLGKRGLLIEESRTALGALEAGLATLIAMPDTWRPSGHDLPVEIGSFVRVRTRVQPRYAARLPRLDSLKVAAIGEKDVEVEAETPAGTVRWLLPRGHVQPQLAPTAP